MTFRELDDAVTAPLHGFADTGNYYAKSSSIFVLDRVRIPTLLFNAWDDPLIPRRVPAEAQNCANALRRPAL